MTAPSPGGGAIHGSDRPLVAHVIYRLAVGGTENGIVNVINGMPAAAYRHAVIAMSDIDAGFASRLTAPDVQLIELRKSPGHGFNLYPRLYRLFRDLRPAIVHTRSLASLESQLPAWMAGVPCRIHGEHGWEIGDPDGRNRTYRWVRRAYRPFVTQYVAVSRCLVAYLQAIGVPQHAVEQIHNGVDLDRYRPPGAGRERIAGCPFGAAGEWLIGTVGRMQPIKDQMNLARAFVDVLRDNPAARSRLRLLLVGSGPMQGDIGSFLEASGVRDLAWMPGERNDVASILRGLDCFVLPSLGEGISNTILEAMATGLPVIATDVGGNPELVDQRVTGELVPAADAAALARSIARLADEPVAAIAYGRAGRQRAEASFGLAGMVRRYQSLYDQALERRGRASRGPIGDAPVHPESRSGHVKDRAAS